MRVLKRHSDEGDVSADGAGSTTTEATEVRETRRPTLRERLAGPRRAAATDTTATTTTEPAPTAGQPVMTEPQRPGWRQRFSRSTTVPVTVPKRSIRQTVTVPSRRIESATREPAWDVASILAVLAGGALAVVGIVAVIRTGLDETWFRPRTEVLDANHTPLLGALEIGAGALLLLLGLAGSRVLVALAGIAGALVCTAAAVEPEPLGRELAIEPWWAWALAAAGVALTLAALYEPRAHARRRDAVIDVG